MVYQGNPLGWAPYDLQAPNLEHARNRLWNERNERFLEPLVFESASSRPPQARLLAAAVILQCLRDGRRG